MYDVVKRVDRFVVHCSFGHHESFGQFIANDIEVERCGEHVI